MTALVQATNTAGRIDLDQRDRIRVRLRNLLEYDGVQEVEKGVCAARVSSLPPKPPANRLDQLNVVHATSPSTIGSGSIVYPDSADPLVERFMHTQSWPDSIKRTQR